MVSLQKEEYPQQLKDWLHIVPSIKSIYNQEDSIVILYQTSALQGGNMFFEKDYPLPKTFIDGVMVENEWGLGYESAQKWKHGQNNLKIVLSTPEYLFKDDVVYQYYVKGLMDDWSSWCIYS